MDKRTKSYVIRILRKASVKWYARTEAYKRAFIRAEGRAHIVECAYCKGEFRRKEVQADHINSVVDISKSDYTLDEYAERLFCPPEGYQILCIDCHDQKTGIENEIRLEIEKQVLTSEEGFDKLNKLLKKLIKKRASKKKRTKKKVIKKKIVKKTRTGRGTRTGRKGKK